MRNHPLLGIQFQENILRTILTLEKTYTDLARSLSQRDVKVAVICDRGAMDASVFIERKDWLRILDKLGKHEIELRDSAYDLVVHLSTAANVGRCWWRF